MKGNQRRSKSCYWLGKKCDFMKETTVEEEQPLCKARLCQIVDHPQELEGSDG